MRRDLMVKMERLIHGETPQTLKSVLDNGVLIATRGAGNDLGSALVTSVVESVKKRKAISGPHVLYVSGFDNQSTAD